MTIRNDGNVDLAVSNLAFTGPAAAWFTLDNAANFTLAAGQSRTLAISFDPTEEGPARANLTFTHNDTSDLASGDIDPNPLSVALSAAVVCARDTRRDRVARDNRRTRRNGGRDGPGHAAACCRCLPAPVVEPGRRRQPSPPADYHRDPGGSIVRAGAAGCARPTAC